MSLLGFGLPMMLGAFYAFHLWTSGALHDNPLAKVKKIKLCALMATARQKSAKLYYLSGYTPFLLRNFLTTAQILTSIIEKPAVVNNLTGCSFKLAGLHADIHACHVSVLHEDDGD